MQTNTNVLNKPEFLDDFLMIFTLEELKKVVNEIFTYYFDNLDNITALHNVEKLFYYSSNSPKKLLNYREIQDLSFEDKIDFLYDNLEKSAFNYPIRTHTIILYKVPGINKLHNGCLNFDKLPDEVRQGFNKFCIVIFPDE